MRKTKIVTITSEDRDKGKSFLLREMPAMQTEKWAARALLALGRAGFEVDDDAMSAGAAGIVAAGLGAFKNLDFEDAEPLLDEMMTCISFVPDLTKRDEMTQLPFARPLMEASDVGESDIEEIGTRLKLRGEVLQLHLGFSLAAALSDLGAAAQNGSRPGSSTSRKSSAPSSAGASRRSPKSKRSTG